jgi:hypothetical protein
VIVIDVPEVAGVWAPIATVPLPLIATEAEIDEVTVSAVPAGTEAAWLRVRVVVETAVM